MFCFNSSLFHFLSSNWRYFSLFELFVTDNVCQIKHKCEYFEWLLRNMFYTHLVSFFFERLFRLYKCFVKKFSGFITYKDSFTTMISKYNKVNERSLESLSKRRFCQHGRQPEVSCVDIDGEWWRQPFLFEINNGSQSTFTFMISNKNGWRNHSASMTTQLTSGCRPCWQKRRLLKLSIMHCDFAIKRSNKLQYFKLEETKWKTLKSYYTVFKNFFSYRV